MKNSFLVIGLGRFGMSLAKTLCAQGQEVLAVDSDPQLVDDIADNVTHAVQGDTSDERTVAQLGVNNFDCVIVSVGDDIRASILTTVLCREYGAKHIIAKAGDDMHEKLLLKTGADKVVRPEQDGGTRLARSLISTSILDYLELSDEYSINETHIPFAWVGKSLSELNVRSNYDVSVIAIRRKESVMVSIDPAAPLAENDVLIMIGENSRLQRIAAMKSQSG